MKYLCVLTFALLLPLLSLGQEAPRTLKAPLYTLQIEPARDPSSTSTAQGERLLQCKGCTLDEFTQQLMKPHRVQFEKRVPRTKYDFQLNWKQGELAIHQQDLIRELAKAFDFTTTQTPKPMEVQRLIVTQPERAYKTTDEDDSEMVDYNIALQADPNKQIRNVYSSGGMVSIFARNDAPAAVAVSCEGPEEKKGKKNK